LTIKYLKKQNDVFGITGVKTTVWEIMAVYCLGSGKLEAFFLAILYIHKDVRTKIALYPAQLTAGL